MDDMYKLYKKDIRNGFLNKDKRLFFSSSQITFSILFKEFLKSTKTDLLIYVTNNDEEMLTHKTLYKILANEKVKVTIFYKDINNSISNLLKNFNKEFNNEIIKSSEEKCEIINSIFKNSENVIVKDGNSYILKSIEEKYYSNGSFYDKRLSNGIKTLFEAKL